MIDFDREFGADERDHPGSGQPPEPPQPSSDETPIARSAQLPLNDYGNGQRLVIHFGGDLMFVPRMGWFVWTGKVWAQDFDGMRVRRFAHRIPPLILEEAYLRKGTPREQAILKAAGDAEGPLDELRLKPNPTPEDQAEIRRLAALVASGTKVRAREAQLRGEHIRFAKSAGNSSKITNLLQEASPYVESRIDALNVDPLTMNCQTGTLTFVRDDAADHDWEPEDGISRIWKVEARAHNREDLITKMMPVDFDERAECPEFTEFLGRIQPLPAMRGFLQRWFGYSLLGLTSEQKLVFLHGAGRNGKSTLVDLVARILGDYATSVPIESLTGNEQRKGADATPDLVRLPGARMVRASEPEEAPAADLNRGGPARQQIGRAHV